MTRFAAVELAKDHYFDISRAKYDLNYSPKYTMDQAIKNTVEDLKQYLQREEVFIFLHLSIELILDRK